MNEAWPRFHLAIPVTDLAEVRRFYAELLDCPMGRESERWIDFDFFGHQLVVHLVDPGEYPAAGTNPVDGQNVPVMHFGPVLEWEAFEALAGRLRAAGVDFVIEPQVRFKGRPGEQATMFIRDPSGNHIEFKAFRDPRLIFARDEDLQD